MVSEMTIEASNIRVWVQINENPYVRLVNIINIPQEILEYYQLINYWEKNKNHNSIKEYILIWQNRRR